MIRRIIISVLLTCACMHVQAQVSIITTIAGNGIQGYSGDGDTATNAEFNHPYQLCYFNKGVYIVDGFNHRIRKVDLNSGIISTVAGTDTAGYNGDNILATNAQLFIPQGICVDTSGNLYISDGGNFRIRKVTRATGIITTIAGNGIYGYSGDGAAATNAEMTDPVGISIDKFGNVYFGDEHNYVVRKVTANGNIFTVAGNGTSGYSGDNGPATHAQLAFPQKATVDTNGNIFISDGANRAVRRVDAITGVITTIAGNGSIGYSGDGGPATSASLGGPIGGSFDNNNSFYFADRNNSVIRKINGTTAIITTVAGNGIQGFSGDGGVATAAEIAPTDVCVDNWGTMYIVDLDNNRIRKVYNPKLAVPNETPQAGMANLYPNPAGNELNVIYDFTGKEDGLLQISDVAGRLVISAILPGNKQKQITDIHTLINGVYVYRILQADKIISQGKIIKQ